MKLVIDEEIFKKFPDAVIGALVVDNINNNGTSSDISELLRNEENRIRDNHQSETLSQDPKIDCWRKAYSAFGVKSKDARSSVESLYKVVLRGLNVRDINKLVDLYNYICLKYMLPVGGEDLDKVSGDIYLTVAGSNENPIKVLGDEELETPLPGEIIYKDDNGAICRRWNWREADRTKLTVDTDKALLVIEGLPPASRADVETALSDLKELVVKYCGGEGNTYLLNINNPQIDL